ncbi:MAG: hypothetical protein Q8R67_03070 [Rhodoferax sp.]|nr:hypothetical protein [Rhodoferax sp.]MDP3650644.1 hypothetical protein [Rhodoferax sp.]
MKVILVMVAFAIGGWYWFVGGRQISETDVHGFFQQELQWLDDGKAKEMCASLDEKYTQRMTQVSMAGRVEDEADKAKSCQATEKLFETVDKLKSQFGDGAGVEVSEKVDSIDISSDKKTAIVKVRSVFKMGTEQVLMVKITSETTETFVKRNGKLLRLSAEGKSLIE